MAHMLIKILKVLYAFSFFGFWGILTTILRPLALKRHVAFQQRARQVNKDAAKKLGGDSVFVKLANGITLHAFEAGDRNGKLFILLHGFPDCWHSWHGVIPALVKEGYFVVAPDMRGYNLSDKPKEVSEYYMNKLTGDVKDLIEYYNKKTATLMAHDWGGIVAWAFASRHSDLLEKLIILNAPHQKAYERECRKSVNQLFASWYILFFQIPILAQNVISYDPYRTITTFFKTKKKNALSDTDKEVLACSYAQERAGTSMINYYKGLLRSRLTGARKIEGGPKREKPEKLKVPTLVLWGLDDTALTPGCANCAEFVENVKVINIPDCSHWVPYEVPDIVAREVLKFVK